MFRIGGTAGMKMNVNAEEHMLAEDRGKKFEKKNYFKQIHLSNCTDLEIYSQRVLFIYMHSA